MFINPLLPFIIYQRWLETVVLPYLDNFESKYARYEAEEADYYGGTQPS